MSAGALGWAGIVRLGLVQAMLGAVVVLTTSTLNRVMVVELALPAMLPGLLVALHYAVQMMRPRMGYGSDLGGRRTPWIVGGMAVLALGGFGAAVATAWMAAIAAGRAWHWPSLSFALVGPGRQRRRHLAAGAAGQARASAERRAAAATIVWVMMIVGFAVTAGAGRALARPVFAAAADGRFGAGVAAGVRRDAASALRDLEGSRVTSRRRR